MYLPVYVFLLFIYIFILYLLSAFNELIEKF